MTHETEQTPIVHNAVSAVLFECLKLPIDTPLCVVVRRGEAENFLAALRIKLSRVRKEAEKRQVLVAPFFLSCLSIEHHPERDQDFLFIARKHSRIVQHRELEVVEAIAHAGWEDRRRLLDRLESETVDVLRQEIRKNRETITELKSQTRAVFDLEKYRTMEREYRAREGLKINESELGRVEESHACESCSRAEACGDGRTDDEEAGRETGYGVKIRSISERDFQAEAARRPGIPEPSVVQNTRKTAENSAGLGKEQSTPCGFLAKFRAEHNANASAAVASTNTGTKAEKSSGDNAPKASASAAATAARNFLAKYK